MKYHLARGEEQLGTFSDLEVSSGLRDGRFKPGDLCWTEGMPDWQTLEARMEETNPQDEPDTEAPAPVPYRIADPQEGNAELATPGRRLLAKMLDWVMFFTPMVMILLAMMDGVFEHEIQAVQNDPVKVMEALQRQMIKLQQAESLTLTTMSWLILLLLVSNVVLLTIRGQSLGKWLCRIRIVSGDGSRAGFFRVVLLRWFLFAIIQSVQIIGPVLMMVDYGMVLRPDRRCLHDHAADTKVITC
jgi:uncharacterized RDD family membrane protein YckC